MIITIDGPSASGKSSVARHIARQLSAYYIYSGLLYRAVAYVLHDQYGYTQETIADVQESDVDDCVKHITYVCHDSTTPQIYFDDNEITSYLKYSHVDTLASQLSTNAYVRSVVDRMQRDIAMSRDAVIDGRDAGTTVFPDADVKFYITAAAYVRALRWRHDQKQLGNIYTLRESLHTIHDRDYRDSCRTVSPLVPAADAFHIDNSQLDIQQTARLIRIITHYYR